MKPPKNYSEPVSLETLSDGYCKLIKNAQRLIDDGEMLIKCKRFLGAVDFFRLATEELAKAELINQYVYHKDDDKEKWKCFWNVFHRHEEKLKLLDYKFHLRSYKDRKEFDGTIKKLLDQREESIYVQFDYNKKEFLKPEDFFRSNKDIEIVALNESKYARKLFEMFTASYGGIPTTEFMLNLFKHIKENL